MDLYVGVTEADEHEEEADLPKDEAGRRKIKRQYEELLGIRIEKLKGRILNRERINKTIEGIYFICDKCLKVCRPSTTELSRIPPTCITCAASAASPAPPRPDPSLTLSS